MVVEGCGGQICIINARRYAQIKTQMRTQILAEKGTDFGREGHRYLV